MTLQQCFNKAKVVYKCSYFRNCKIFSTADDIDFLRTEHTTGSQLGTKYSVGNVNKC